MTPETIYMIGQDAMVVAVKLTAPVLLPSLVIGLIIAMFQAATQINEMTLTFVPKLIVIGIVLLFLKPKERVIVKTIKEKRKKKDYSGLDKKEKEVVDLLLNEGNAMFQADLMEKIGIGKVGVTRLLDKLEAKQVIERKRRGMNNIVVLKD